ncbi:MAG: hypothetical protein OEZ02_13955, partial [Anaerolineae bacterium]|nr:hypothetical protein [Anaerolineae bacterium]
MARVLRAQLYVLLRSGYAWFAITALVMLVNLSILFPYFIVPMFVPDYAVFDVNLSFPNLVFHVLIPPIKSIGLVIGMFLGAVVIGSDYEWGTVRLALLRGTSRWQVALAKWMALIGTMAIAVGLSVETGYVSAMVGVNWRN